MYLNSLDQLFAQTFYLFTETTISLKLQYCKEHWSSLAKFPNVPVPLFNRVIL